MTTGIDVTRSEEYGVNIPFQIIQKRAGVEQSSLWVDELGKVAKLYVQYEQGAAFRPVGGGGDYNPSDMSYKKANNLINKQARFMFSKPPEFTVETAEELSEKTKERLSTYQNLLDSVLKESKFESKITKAGRDCFIGKRVALVVNANEDDGITVEFFPATDFIYEYSETGKELEMLSTFSLVRDSKNKQDKRVFNKHYTMVNGTCHIEETLYDGVGNALESSGELKTDFTFIPATVILNDGLTGDTMGISDLEAITAYEASYSRMSNADMDAEIKSMNPIRFTVDADSASTKGLSSSAGSFWDIATDGNSPLDNVKAQVGLLEAGMNYKDALGDTLSRIDVAMRETLDMPDLSAEALKGVVSSGKTLKALYWSLIVRCDEKMLEWKPALEFMAETIILSAVMYPNIAKMYIDKPLEVDWGYNVSVSNQYPLPEDELEEKQMDIIEVQAQVMSRKAYMKKWRGLTDDECMDELKQIAEERQMLEDTFSQPPYGDNSKQNTEF